MKKECIFSIFSCAIAVALCFISCAKENELDEWLSASRNKAIVPLEINLDGNGASKTINIDADCEWNFSNVPVWLTLSATNGNGYGTIELTPTVNPSSVEVRNATMTFNAGDRSKTITLIQGTALENLLVSVPSLSFDNTASSSSFAITSNGTWKITGEKDWFAIDKTEGNGDSNVKVNVQENTSEDERQAELTIQGSSKTQTVTIVQKGRDVTLSLSISSITASAVESTYTIVAEGTAKWTASTSDTWITIDKSAFEGSATSVKTTIIVTCKDNNSSASRTGEVVITWRNGTKTLKCAINQKAGDKPEVGDVSITDIAKNSFKASSSYSSDFPVTEYGFCYSKTNKNPTIEDSKVELSGTDKSGDYSASITGLKSGATYYVRAYAKNGVGYSYGTFTTVTTLGDRPENNDNPDPNL